VTAGRPSNLGRSTSMAGRAAGCCWRMMAATSRCGTGRGMNRGSP